MPHLRCSLFHLLVFLFVASKTFSAALFSAVRRVFPSPSDGDAVWRNAGETWKLRLGVLLLPLPSFYCSS